MFQVRAAFGLCAGVALLALSCAAPHARPMPIDTRKVVDLSYGFGPDTIYWPTAESFHLVPVAHGRAPLGYWYAANNMCMAEHGGTHMDAPIHFAEHGLTADAVPLRSGIGPAAVIDARAQAARDPDYRLSVDDIRSWEKRNGRLPAGAIVVMWSGWGQFWPNKVSYLGTDQKGDVAHLHFPGYSKEAAEFLVKERDIAAIGVDTASIDYGQSADFPVHQVISAAGKPAYENLANVDGLPAIGATLIALPMKISGGSGAPARIIAILP